MFGLHAEPSWLALISAALLIAYPLGMPRAARLDAPLALQHVWNRGIERRPIVLDDADRLDFLTRIAPLVQAAHFAVYAWALMTNHFHLLTRTGTLGLSSSMQILLGDYASAFNDRHQRGGHLFQNRFKSTLVEEDSYFLALVRYLHLNPLRAGIVADLEGFRDVGPKGTKVGRRWASCGQDRCRDGPGGRRELGCGERPARHRSRGRAVGPTATGSGGKVKAAGIRACTVSDARWPRKSFPATCEAFELAVRL